MATRSKKTEPEDIQELETDNVVEKLEEPKTTAGEPFVWKSYRLFFAEGEKAGGPFGFLICSSAIPLVNINGTMMGSCNVKAMDIRASDEFVNKKNVDPQ
jgi:hypothetical protein